MKLKSFIILAITFSSMLVLGQGFDEDYVVYQGDHNSDGRIDFHIRKTPEIIILHGDIATPIVIPSDVEEFFLSQNSLDNLFEVQSVNSGFDFSGWSRSELEIDVKDVNFDGFADLKITGLSKVVAGALDQIVFAGSNLGKIPTHITAMTETLEQFSLNVFQWGLDPNYFNDNAPLKVVGQEPAVRYYAGSIFDPTNLLAINNLIANCKASFSSFGCGTSTINPSDCLIQIELFNEFGESTGFYWDNVCDRGYIHVYAYEPGTVTLERDYSLFNQEAINFAEAVETITDGGLEGLIDKDPESIQMRDLSIVLAEIIKRVFGNGIFGERSSGDEVITNPGRFCQADNSFEHASFPLDETFNRNDLTFHHYDVETWVCDYSNPACGFSNLTYHMLRKFTYPSRKLVATDPSFDGFTRTLAYVSPPHLTHKPAKYVIPVGHVTQTDLNDASNWPSAIQNLTRTNHAVYPGTISRVIVEKSDGFYIFTHGIGLNRAFNTHLYGLRPIHIAIGCLNDVFGEKAFRQLDKQAIKYWDSQ